VSEPLAARPESRVFVARQPVVDRREHVYGYELLFRDSLDNVFPRTDGSRASARVIADSALIFGIRQLTGGRRAFINFTRETLLAGYAQLLPRELLVVEVLESVRPEPEVVEACRELRRLGYTLALDDFPGDDWESPLVALAHMVKVDVRVAAPSALAGIAAAAAKRGLLPLAEKVETRAEYEAAAAGGYQYFQGFFLSAPVVVSGRQISTVKLQLLRLIAQVHAPTLDIPRVAEVIERDVALSYKLLRFINSAFFSFKTRITSVRHGLTLIGDAAIRKWVSLLALAEIAADRPTELLRSSLARARACELIVERVGRSREAGDAFLVGLFSQLDALLGVTMAEALTDLPISAPSRAALLGGGPLRPVLDGTTACERGAWAALGDVARALGVADAAVAGAHLEALAWAEEAAGVAATSEAG
jgi:EAL and modified HD-GYP domain-containing signal transduction protein